MAKPAVDFDVYLKRIPSHSVELPHESDVPLDHYSRSANDAWNLLTYVHRNISETTTYEGPRGRHLGQLATMALLGIIEAFERFLKELASECVDHVATYILDDRLDIFYAHGDVIAAHFQGNKLGKALCEPLTWCDCKQPNERFRRVLKDPFERAGDFYIFPNQVQLPVELRNRQELMSLVWQLRHSIAHNAAVVTPSDALKFRLLSKSPVPAPRVLRPSRPDVWYVKLFLDETAALINRAVGERLAQLLTKLHARDSTLFSPSEKAQQLANTLRTPITISGESCNPA
jgi:hypothetical protein